MDKCSARVSRQDASVFIVRGYATATTIAEIAGTKTRTCVLLLSLLRRANLDFSSALEIDVVASVNTGCAMATMTAVTTATKIHKSAKTAEPSLPERV